MAEETAPKPPPRKLYMVLQAVSAAALIGVSLVTRKFEQIFIQMEMRELPLPTEAFLALSRLVNSQPGRLLVAAATALLLVLARRGMLDRVLKPLLKINIVYLVLLGPFWVLSIYMPIVKIQQTLAK